MTPPENRLIVVSNRLPFVIQNQSDGGPRLVPGSGGLVTALAPVLRNRGGMWIGWPGQTGDISELARILADATNEAGYTLIPISLTREEYDKFYCGYANETLWPLFHDLQWQCHFDPEYWHAYVAVNRKYAETIMRHGQPDDFTWVHDYHLMYVAQALRELGFQSSLAFFLHIPFPPFDIFIKLPERHKLLDALLKFDLIGFQTQCDRRNFVHCVRALIKNVRIRATDHLHTIRLGEREVRVGTFPIGIDFNEFSKQAASQEVAQRMRQIHEELPNRQIVLGVDRLDYTKGIPQRMKAFRDLLRRYPDLIQRINLVLVVVPSRVGIPKYDALKTDIERLAGEINGQFTQSGWVPIHYAFRSLERQELLAYYRAAEIGLVTPLKDGMNLVAKEFCASSVEGDSVLILSEFAGAAAQLKRGALMVNPYDVEQTADAIHQAFHMSLEEQRTRMRQLRRSVKTQNIYWWVDSFIQTAINKELGDFPIQEEYIPENPDLSNTPT